MVRVLMTFFGCLLGWGYQFSEVVNPSEGLNTVHCVQKITQMLIKFNFRFGWLWFPCISVGLFLVIYDAMSYIGAPFLYIHKIDYFFHIVLFSNFWKISYFPGKNCQFCEYKKSELQYNSWHHERPEKNLLAFVGSITYRIWIKSIFWNCFLHCGTSNF